ncbi:HD domain-containing protein [Streptomyces sp. PBH53]|uniref:HD domain-containing protein n=1 Tax=Streptomyces sp. PBH53 TaxID=1577075 RepID=UPI000AB811A7|nr:HD domain-containing protein [Streptomyces sp. PBH53]
MTHASKDGQRPSRRTVLQRGAGVAAAGAATAFTGPPAAAHPLPSPRSETLPAAVAGVRIPDSGPARQAVRLARRVSSETLFHHVMRTYVFGALLFDRRGVRYDRELAFVAAVLHDLGLVEEFRTPAERFEVDGADAARRFLERLGMPAERVEVVWDAIALHTSVGIATRKRPEIALVSVGSGLDFTGDGLERIPSDALDAVLTAFPRRGFKQEALDTVLSLCRTKPMAELMHPFAEVGRRHLPGFPVPTLEDLLLAAPFDE